MDYFCIERGTLFDNPDVATLVNPGVHSVHWYVAYLQLKTQLVCVFLIVDCPSILQPFRRS